MQALMTHDDTFKTVVKSVIFASKTILEFPFGLSNFSNSLIQWVRDTLCLMMQQIFNPFQKSIKDVFGSREPFQGNEHFSIDDGIA